MRELIRIDTTSTNECYIYRSSQDEQIFEVHLIKWKSSMSYYDAIYKVGSRKAADELCYDFLLRKCKFIKTKLKEL